MKIKVNGFGPIKEMELDAPRICALLGKNGAGKTSFRKAMEYALTGNIDDRLIRQDLGACRAKIELAGKTLERQKKLGKQTTVRLDGTVTSATAMEAAFAEAGVRLDTAVAHIGADFFSGLKNPSEIARWLMDIIPATMPKAEAAAGLSLSPEAEAKLLAYLPEGASVTAGSVKDAYQKAFTARRDVNRDLKRDLALAGGELEAPEDDSERERLVKRRENLRREKEEFVKAKASYTALKKAAEAAAAKKAELEAKLSAFADAEEPNPDTLRKGEEKGGKWTAQKGQVEAMISSRETRIASLEKEIEKAGSGTCPLNEAVKCSYDWTAHVGRLKAQLEEEKAGLSANQASLAKLEKNLAGYAEWKKDADAKTARWQEKQQAEAALAAMQASAPVPEEPVPSVDFDAVIRQTDEEISDFDSRKGAREAAARVEVLKEQAGLLDEVVKALEPGKGLQELILRTSISQYQNALNSRAKKMGLAFRFIFLDDDGNVCVKARKAADDGTVVDVDIDQLSSGEFTVAAFMLSLLATKVDHCRVFFIDNIDRMDGEVLTGIISLLKSEKNIESIILTGVSHTDTLEVLKAQLIPVYDIGNGLAAM